jgi:hypothetical protein
MSLAEYTWCEINFSRAWSHHENASDTQAIRRGCQLGSDLQGKISDTIALLRIAREYKQWRGRGDGHIAVLAPVGARSVATETDKVQMQVSMKSKKASNVNS